MKKILLTLTLLFAFSFSVYAIENKTQYGQWNVNIITNNIHNPKIILLNNNTENCNLTMLFTDNIIRINVLFENIKSTNDKLYLKFDNSQLIDITTNTVLNDKEYLSYNLYLINDRINQDKDIISFCKKIIQNKILKISFDKKCFIV